MTKIINALSARLLYLYPSFYSLSVSWNVNCNFLEFFQQNKTKIKYCFYLYLEYLSTSPILCPIFINIWVFRTLSSAEAKNTKSEVPRALSFRFSPGSARLLFTSPVRKNKRPLRRREVSGTPLSFFCVYIHCSTDWKIIKEFDFVVLFGFN